MTTAATHAQILEQQLAKADADVVYWKARAERLIDAGLARTGAIGGPTMVEPAPVHPGVAALSGMAIREIDSSTQQH